MTRPIRKRIRSALDAAAGVAWISAIVVVAAELFKTKRTGPQAGPPPPPPARGIQPPPPPPSRRPSRRPPGRGRRLAVPIVATALAAALGLPGATFGLGLLSGQATESPKFTAISAGVETSDSAADMMRMRRKVFDIRPSPSPTPEPPPPPPPSPTPEAAVAVAPPPVTATGSVVDIIRAAAARHGVDGDWMVRIAQCESGLNPSAVNPAGYYGLFQFSKSTWGAYGSGDIFDPAAQSEATAKMLAAGGAGHWPHCSKQ